MTEFERDVIDRLARIEENAKSGVNTSATVLAQGLRLDALEKRLNQFKDRTWGIVAFITIFGIPIVTYLRVQIFGAFHQ